ncbi:MAG: monofunctional biosynthetic peptidoglycan transglycosylase [Cellvibrionaceae bacterium]
MNSVRTATGVLLKLVRYTVWAVIAFAVASVLLVVILRWAPPPTAGIIVQRQFEDSREGRLHYFVWTPWEDMAPAVALAVIAAEDQRFFHHWGFDFDQLQRAIDESRRGGRLRGASTITQQTAKNLFLWNGRSYLRKGLEAWFAVLIETLWPKQRILEVYLNIVEFGPEVYGINSASRRYFQKLPAQISPYEAALLAAVLPNPHVMHVNNPSAYVRERQGWILGQMSQLGGESLIQR